MMIWNRNNKRNNNIFYVCLFCSFVFPLMTHKTSLIHLASFLIRGERASAANFSSSCESRFNHVVFFFYLLYFYYIDDNMRQLCLSCWLKLPGCNEKVVLPTCGWNCVGVAIIDQLQKVVFFWYFSGFFKVLSEPCTSSLLFQHRCALTSQEREHDDALYACPSLTGSKVFCFFSVFFFFFPDAG